MKTTEIAFRSVSTIGSKGAADLSFVYDKQWATDTTGDQKHYAAKFADVETLDTAKANKGYLKEKFQIKASQA